MSTPLHQQLRATAKAWREAGLERHLTFASGVDFTSNDYLGLAQDARVIQAAQKAAQEWGVGAPGARLLHGNLPIHQQAEAEAAHWMNSEAALLFPSGWQANQALLSTFADRDDVLFCDALNHASLIDAARLSRARVEVFAHNQVEALAQALARHPAARRRIVVVEDVYSMDGDRAPLSAILQACAQADAYLILDMAHSAGLYSSNLGTSKHLLARMFTGGKALGLGGAFVCASQLVVDTLINHGRSFIFTTAVPPMLAAALLKAMQIIQAEPERTTRLFARADLLRRILREHGILCPGESPILPVIIGSSERAMEVAKKLREQGHEVRAVRPPTVAKGCSRLRIVVHAQHQPQQIETFAKHLVTALAAEKRRAVIEDPAPPTRPKALIVCGTDTGVGKTVVSALLLRAVLRQGHPAHYLKPIQTGLDSDTQTVSALSSLDSRAMLPPLLSLPLPASVDQAADAAATEVQVKTLLEKTHATLQTAPSAQWIVETAGGLRVPWNDKEDQADFVQSLRFPCVLVARSGLGTLNHTLLTAEALRARRIPLHALFLVGPTHPQNHRSLTQHLPSLPLFEIPLFKDLSAKHLDLWLDAEARLLSLFEALH